MRQQTLPLLLLLLLLPSARRCERFLLGYITGLDRRPGDRKYERPGRTVSGAISLAVERVNGRGGELWARGHSLHFEVAETYGEETTSIRRTAELWRRNITAYIGPQETCVHEARMAAAFNLPMVSYFCTHQETSDKAVFPTFARTRPPDTQISKSVASVLLAFNWTQVSFLYLNSAEGEFRTVAATILETLKAAGVRVHFTRTWSEPYHHGYAPNHFTNIVADTYLDTRIYVILGYYYEHLGLMAAMEEKKLFDNGEYWVVGVDIEQYDADNPGKYLRDLLRQQEDANATRAFRCYLGVAPSAPRDMTNFSQLVSSYIQLPPFNIPNPVSVVGGVRLIRPEAAYLYDAVLVYSHALVAVLDAGGDPRNGTAIIDAVKRRHYSSAMGYMVYMDENGDAEGNYTLLARQRHHREPGEYGMYPVGVFTRSASGRRALPDLQMTATIDWVGGRPPIAEPPCGFRDEKCISHTGEIAGGIAGGLALVLLVVSLVLYRNWRYEQELDSLLWKVDWRDIQLNDENTNSSLGAKVARAVHPLIRTSQVSLSSNPDADFRYSAIYTQIGIYKGRVFAIKKVHKKSVDITRSMKKELKMMRDLRHDNLNAFIGACTDPPNICIVTEYCARGSLKDILENEDVKLDNMFIASLVGDIIRGMLYLHESAIRVHGNLKTSNCLVDSRWVLKLADFGLHEFKAGQEEQTDAATVSRRCEGLLFRAPELLRAPSWGGGSQKADVYAFAMVLFALHARHPPWAEAGLAPADVVRRVAATEVPPFRPQLEALENTFDCVRDCLKECWSEMPEERPDFKAIRTRLRPLRKGMKPNIFDNMMAMMEKYANNLEALVDERTDQLVEEKKKTEALLFEMLPRSVAEQLRRGHKVEAESFDCVTIYFSDIVGFTAMSAESTPLQVVDFLNDLYTCFDSTIENYDVYKVETIGDAYMVVSGLPIRNGNEHAAEIASMSLHLLDNVRRFRVRHRPNDSLQLRIGIHSGPVCAGVVGLKMPRYCLFGDTVNTASRMESTGLPLKIHCSAACKRLLEQLGGYQLAERGLVCMKGKGEQLTYWLLGEEPRMRSARTEQRAARRAAGKAHQQQQQQQQAANGCLGPRSSLKSRLARCSSLESPKRLRFGVCTEYPQLPSQAANVDGHPLLEVIADQSPCKSSKDSSSSCPCIENCCGSEGGGDGVGGGGGGGGGFPPDRNHSEPALLLHYGAGAETEAEAQRPLLTSAADGLSDSQSDADTDDGETPV
ncbi:guanylate cyclase 32E [Schistocerca cancellata]|uniref:guanylate cyclase 32E n=1 Tax=Schistocerca cancellata TaxID=274614 RepID=UPI0021177FE3|nr:guanylate cyclase 32E [Schistocerca cancellata]